MGLLWRTSSKLGKHCPVVDRQTAENPGDMAGADDGDKALTPGSLDILSQDNVSFVDNDPFQGRELRRPFTDEIGNTVMAFEFTKLFGG